MIAAVSWSWTLSSDTASPTWTTTRRWSSAWPIASAPSAPRASAARIASGSVRIASSRIGRRPGLRAEVAEQAPGAGEDDAGQQQVLDRPPAGAAREPQLEVRHRPQQDGDDRHQQDAEPAGDEPPEHGRGDAGHRGHRIARQPESGRAGPMTYAAASPPSASCAAIAMASTTGSSANQPTAATTAWRIAMSTAAGRSTRRRTASARRSPKMRPITASSSRSASADRVASSWSASSHARRATSTA